MQTVDDKTPRPTPIKQQRESFVPLTLLMLAAPLAWVLHFALVYLLEGFLCMPMTQSPAVITGVVVIATVTGVALCIGLWVMGDRWQRKLIAANPELRNFLCLTQRLLAGLSLIAIIWTASGALLLAPCSIAY